MDGSRVVYIHPGSFEYDDHDTFYVEALRTSLLCKTSVSQSGAMPSVCFVLHV